MKNRTNIFFHRLERLLMSRAVSKAFSWLLIVQIFVQSIAPYPFGLLVRNANAQESESTPTVSQSVVQSSPTPSLTLTPSPTPSPTTTVASPLPSPLPSQIETPTPKLTVTSTPVPAKSATVSVPNPTTKPSLAIEKQILPSPTSGDVVKIDTSLRKHTITLNTSENKKTYKHREIPPAKNEEVTLRTAYAKAFKVSEQEAFADPDFDKDEYKKLQKDKKSGDTASSYVPPKSDRIKDAELGRKAEPTPTPLPPYPGNGQRLSPNEKQKTVLSKPTEQKQEQMKKVTPTPTIFYPQKAPKDPNTIVENPIIKPKESNKDIDTASDAGLYRFKVSLDEPIHYADVTGKYKDIDTSVVVDETPEYEFTNAAGSYEFRAAKTLSGGVRYTSDTGKVCRFGLSSVAGVDIANVEGVAEGNKLIYKNIYAGADLEFTLTGSGVRTEVVAKDKSARKKSYQFDLYDCELDFQKPTAYATDSGVSASVDESIKMEDVSVKTVADGKTVSQKIEKVKTLTITPNYTDFESKDLGLLSKLGTLFGSGQKKAVSDNEVVRIDPTLSTWIYSGETDKANVGRYTDPLYYIGTTEGREDSRTFYWFNRDSIPNANFDVIGGYMSIFQEASLGDTAVAVYQTRFGQSTNGGDSIVSVLSGMQYPGIKSALPDLVAIDASGNVASQPADKTGIPQYKDGSVIGWRRVHVPPWMFARWKTAPSAAEGGWVSKEGLMIASAASGGMRYRSGYHSDTNTRPWINVYMSSDTPNPDRGRPPTIPDVYMPRSGSYVQAAVGNCDESTSPPTGACRTTTYVPLVTGAGDPDGWGPGDILGVQYSVWGEGYASYPFVYGTSPGITANLDVADNIYYWSAYSKDRTNRISGGTSNQVFVTDTTPPSVPVVDSLPAFTPGVGLNNVRQVDVTSSGSYDDMHVKLSTTFGTYYTIAYQAQYSTSAGFTSNVYSLPWQSNNPNFNISAYGADQQAGTADDLVENTKYYFRIKARDYYGNISAWSNVTSTTLDSVAPTIGSNTLSSQRASVSSPASWTAGYTESNPETAKLRLSQTNTQTATVPDSLDKKPPQVFNLSNSNSFSGVSVRVGTIGYLYVQAGNLLRKVRASDGVVVAQIPVSGDPFAVTYDGTYVYTLTMGGELKRIDPVRDVVFSTVQSAHVNATEVTAAEGFLWANRYDTNTITKINPSTGAVLCFARATSMGGGEIPNVKYINGKLWATDTASRHIFAINTANCQTQLLSAQTPSAPIDITADAAGYIWTTAIGGQLIKINPTNGAILTTLSVAGGFHTIDYDGVNFWMANIYSAYMAAISPIDGHVVETQVTANNQGYHAAFDGRYVWLVHYGGGSKVTRVDTGRWYENAAAANIIQQSIAIPDIVNARSLGSLPTGYAYRGTSVTVAGTKYVYAIQHGQGAVSKIRSSDAKYMSTIQLDKTKFASLAGISSSGTTIYVASHEGWVGVIDATTDTLTNSYQVATVSEMLMNVAEYGGDLWISYYGTPKVVKLDKATFAKKCEVSIAQFGSTSPISTHLDVIGGNLWTNHVTGGRLIRIGSDCKVAAVTPSQSGQASQMFTDGKYVWEISYYNARAYAYDLQTGAYVKEYPIASGPTAGVYDGKNYWITTAGNPEKIVKYDANFAELSRYSVTNGNVSSQDVLKDGKYLWFLNFDTGSLSRFDSSKDQPYAVVPSELTVMEQSQTLTNSGTVSMSFDTKTASGSAVPDGSYKASLILSDKAGQTSQVDKVVVVDNSAPTFTLSNSLASGWVTDNAVLLQGQLAASHVAGHEDFDVASFEYRFGSTGAWTPISYDTQNIFNTTITAPAGTSTLTLRASDSTQNKSEQSFTIHTDTAPPQLSSITPSTLYAGKTPTLRYHVEETTAGSNIPYGTNPQGMKVQLQYTYNGTAIVKTLVDNGVVGDPAFASSLTCAPSAGATTATDNGTPVASAVDCNLPVVSDLPETLYNVVVWAKDYAGHEVTDYSSFQLKASIYHEVQSPEPDAHIASGSALLQGTTSRGAQITMANTQLGQSKQFTLSPTLAGTGTDGSFILNNFVVTCGVMRDTDNNPATPDEEVCDWHTRVASSIAQTDTDVANTLTITAGDGYGNDKVKTISYFANPYSINLSLQPANQYFSPNGDGQLDGVVFATSIDQGIAVSDWTITIKNAQNSSVRTLSGTGSLPTSITWDGKDSSGTAVSDGEYTWSAQVHANGLTFNFPSTSNQSSATLTAKSSISDAVLIMSPSTGYVTSAGVVAVAGLAPATVAATDLTQNKLKGAILVRICVDTQGTSADCDYTANANVDSAGNFSTLVVLPKPVGDQTATHTITAYAYDEYGNSTPTSNAVTVTTDTRGSIVNSSATTLTPASTADAYTAYQAGNASIDTVANAWIRVSVSQYTQYLKLSYAPHTIRDGLYQATGELTTIGYINNQVESDANKNPDADSRVKHVQGTNPITSNYAQAIANTCQVAAGCEWYVRLPVSPTQAGVYDVLIQAVKGEAVSEASVGYRVDASSPNAPTVAMVDQVVDGSPTVAYSYANTTQVRTPRVRMYGATTAGSKLRFMVGTTSKVPVDMYANALKVNEVAIGEQGIYEVDVDVSNLRATGTSWDTFSCSARDAQGVCVQATFTLTPQSYELDSSNNLYHIVDGESTTFTYDAQPPTATAISATTTGVDLISPWGKTGTPIHYDVTTSDTVRFAQIQRPDTFTRVFETAPSNSQAFSATFNMAKNDAIGSATMLDREGYFNPVITLVDYAGNTSTYDAASYGTYGLGDFRGRIDDSQPLTARMPFATWGEGGKAAHDAPLTQDSVYINTLSQGFVTRSKTVHIKALAERGQRVQFKINGVNQGALVDVTAQNCTAPAANIPSSETPDTTQNMQKGEDLVWNPTTGEYMLPTTDRTSANGLTVRAAQQCEVSTTYTFPGDGTSHQEDGTPTEAIDAQLTSVDKAGNLSNITAPIKIYYDTFAPKEPEAILYQDDIGVRGERMGYYDIKMTSPNGTVTATGQGVLDGDGDSMEIVHKIFTDEYGIFTIVVHTYDAAGNVSTTTRTIDRQPSDPNPADGVGGGSGGSTSFAWPNVSVYVYSNGTYTETGATVAVPKNVLGSYNNNSTFNIQGNALSVGHPATIKVTYQSLDKVIQDRCKNYGRFMSACISALQGQVLRTSIDKTAKVSDSYVRVVDHNTSGFLDEFANTSSFSKSNIAISSTSHQIRAASKIKIAGTIAGTNFSSSNVHQSYSTDPVTLDSKDSSVFKDAISPVSDSSCNGVIITSNFGPRDVLPSPHNGYDLAKSGGCDVLAVADGDVEVPPFDSGGYGTYIKIKHNDTFTTLYGHAASLYVSNGQRVSKGQKILRMGSTGNSGGTHLHFSIFKSDIAVDPTTYIQLSYPKSF